MSLKKKLTMGALSATLGLSLVAGGTWAAFNDIESQSSSLATGKLDLQLKQYQNKPYTFKITNLKPGDSMTREVVLHNAGTLAIKDVLMSMELVTFNDYNPADDENTGGGDADLDTWGANNAIQYLDQFKVKVIKVGAEGGAGGFPKELVLIDGVTLKDFYLASDSLAGNTNKLANGATSTDITAAMTKVWNSVNRDYLTDYRLNVSTINPDEWTGLPLIPKDDDRVKITIEFDDKKVDSNGDGTWDQNMFQGDTADIQVSFEARQWGGLDVKDSDLNSAGSVETNKKANSEAGNPKRP
jgi:spore coat-associated protein N